jgi:hypothetical protein
MAEGSLLLAEERPEGVLLRPAVAVPVAAYSDERVAEFLLSNAIDPEDYSAAAAEVRRMGLDPDAIEHVRPPA